MSEEPNQESLQDSTQKNKIKNKAINEGKALGKKITADALDKAGKFFIGPLPLGGWCCIISCAWFLACCIIALIIWLAVEIGLVKGQSIGNCGSLTSGQGCYLEDKFFTDTSTVSSADYVLEKLKKYPKLKSQKDKVEKIIAESQKAGINPAILIAFWNGEQSFGNPDAAFGCGVYGGKKRFPGFENQIRCALNCIKKAINNQAPYNQPQGTNAWTRLMYNYSADRQELYHERGYVSSDTDDPRITILKQLVPDQVVCNTNTVKDGWLTGAGANKIIRKPATNPKIVNSNTIEPKIIVLHYTGNTKDSAKSIWDYFNSGAEGRGAWTHFIIDQDGTIYQMAPVNKKAVHVKDYNNIAIGIEGCGNYEKKPPTEAQYNSYLSLVKSLISEYNIPKTNVYGHYELNTCRSDPGKDFLNRIRKDLNIDNNNPHGGNPLSRVRCNE